MYFKSQFMLYVGTGESKDRPTNQFSIWEDTKKTDFQRMKLPYEILNIKFRSDKIIACLHN